MRVGVTMLVGACLLLGEGVDAGERRIRVLVEFRGTETVTSDDAAVSGSVVVERRTRGRLGLDAAARERRSRRSTGVFTVVQDGGSSMLNVARTIPYRDVVFLRDYAIGAGYVADTIRFEEAGTWLRVDANVLPDDRIRLRLVPEVRYLSETGSGIVDFTEAETELVVRSGERVSLGGATSRRNDLRRTLFGLGSSSEATESDVAVTATFER